MANLRELSLVNCNLYNLNLPGHRIYRDSDGWTPEQYAKKVQWTARTLKSVEADVYAFQELWHKDALKDVFEAAGLLADYDLLVPPNHTGSKIVCAAAVKKELLDGEPEWITKFPDQFKLASGGDDDQTAAISVNINSFSRPVLHFNIKPRENLDATSVYVAHFKSKGPTAVYREGWYRDDADYYSKHYEGLGSAVSTIRRTAEAAALRMLIVDRIKHNDFPLIAMGDLNDSQLSNTLNILTGQPNYLTGLSMGGSDTDMYSVATLQEYRSLRDIYYTHIHNHIRESLDHILVSQEFYDNSRKRQWIFKGMEIFNDHLADEDHKETGTTDHGIVKAIFKYDPA